MSEMDKVEIGIYRSLIRMYQATLNRGAVGRKMIEAAYHLDNGGLETWVNEKVAAVEAKIAAVEASERSSIPVQGADRV